MFGVAPMVLFGWPKDLARNWHKFKGTVTAAQLHRIPERPKKDPGYCPVSATG